ncbi:uncharacterized protein C7orf50 homolog [Thalassophryne amazonica]|uniref:uncharacterized protein C7orf50 homolog n=1 Tax=Thalassophryne amazonica TaxID=390379 RepID=UPI0014723EB8|nr:uncharacterized protein C7orf50 homolog [Thalassophryne amazonica]
MAKDKLLKSDSKGRSPKRKKTSNDSEVCTDEIIVKTLKNKRKKTEIEESPVQIPQETVKTGDNKKQKNDQRTNKEKMKRNKTETSEPPTCSEAAHEQDGVEDLSPEERRVFERKLKKILKKEEKKKLKAEGKTFKSAEASGPTAPQQALDYLTCWAESRKEWKFQKTRQTWLLQHMFDSEKIPDEKFSVLLQYLEGLRGGSRDTTVQKSLAVVQHSGQAPEDTDVQQRAHRAREVIQLLS